MGSKFRRNIAWGAAAVVVGVGGLVACAQMESLPPPLMTWKSLVTPEGQGVVKTVDGKPQQQRYKEGPFDGVTADWSQYRTYAYSDTRPEPAVEKAALPKDLKGDPKEGRKIFMSRAIGPCTGCHLIRGDDVWPAGNVGPDLSSYGELGRKDEETYQLIHDVRAVYQDSVMPPWGTQKILTPQQIVHLVAFLNNEKGPLPPEKDPARNPETRPKPVGFGDNLDPTNNPAILEAESAGKDWAKKGPKGKSCADCHTGGVEKTMKGVATRYPRFVKEHGRIMSMEEFLQTHGPETTGIEMPSQSKPNLNMSMLVKLQSNGMPLNLDLGSPEAKAALKRGQTLFNKRVGQRNHACADCHIEAPGKGGNKFLGGRLLATLDSGLTNHFPLWRTNFTRVWDPRKRFQWCMLPLGMNYLAADSVEYAEMEFYLASIGQGKPLTAPGIRH
jgi:sulfur-oxidizing protein SoxA